MLLTAEGQTRDLRQRRRGATAMEYVFVISLIFIAALIGINYLAQATKSSFQNSNGVIQKATDNNQTGP